MAVSQDRIFRALADPTRRALLERLLKHGERTVGELTRAARVSQPAVSKHLRLLKAAGLVRDRPEGRAVHYRAEPRALGSVAAWLRLYTGFWEERFDRRETVLKRMDT
ncbi:MAG TPA: metalloregulator ArsR/SmtB family transcription factor [Steroidobacteraceae bacterium]|nr:metalloregulator ArsR/SmtB family transcription factor [Steroidobacteraceae bacterium]